MKISELVYDRPGPGQVSRSSLQHDVAGYLRIWKSN